MSSLPSSICPACEYVLNAFDGDCPRCHGQGLPSKAPASKPSPGATTPAHRDEAAPTTRAAVAAPASTGSLESGAGAPESAFPTPPPLYGRRTGTGDAEAHSGAPAWFKWGGIALVLLLLVAGVGGYRYWMATPQYSLLQIQSAFNAHDLPRFEQYLAIDSCADALAADLLHTPANKGESGAPLAGGETGDALGNSGWGALGQSLMGGMQTTMANAIKAGARQIVLKGIDGVSAGEGESSFAELWNSTRATVEAKEFSYQGVGGVTLSGETFLVKLNFYSDKTHQVYPIKLRMRRHEGHWQVTEWDNATAFFERLGAAFH